MFKDDTRPARRSPSPTRGRTAVEAWMRAPPRSIGVTEECWAKRLDTEGEGEGEGESESPCSTSTTTPRSGLISGYDSAYGTMDEASSSTSSLSPASKSKAFAATLTRKLSAGRSNGRGLRSKRSRSLGWASDRRRVEDQVEDVGQEGVVDFELGPESSSSDESVSSPSSRQSSPELDMSCECFPPVSPSNKTTFSPSHPLKFASPTTLSRRHTLPRRKRALRRPSVSVSFSKATPDTSVKTLNKSLSDQLPTFGPVTSIAIVLTAVLSLATPFAPVPLLPASPVHLLHPGSEAITEWTNAFLSPFLVQPKVSSVVLGVANLVCLKTLEDEARLGSVEIAGLWGAILAVRVLLAWIFGRVLGWSHPQFFSSLAIHQVGSGLAPLLLALHLFNTFTKPVTSTSSPIPLPLVILGANFSTPVASGGAGLWWGLSSLIVSLVLCLGSRLVAVVKILAERTSFRPFPGNKKSTHETNKSTEVRMGRWSSSLSEQWLQAAPKPSRWTKILPLVTLGLVPLLAPPTALSTIREVDSAFGKLHPERPNLLTILLMTAPRPGNPDFLAQTIESWLGALPEPSLALASNSSSSSGSAAPEVHEDRIRLIVYTHFTTHEVFDQAQQFFSSSPVWASKTAKYVEWYRDPRSSNRLDQRLHVARGLKYASDPSNPSAYVVLAEDDFPLCPDRLGQPGWRNAWNDLKRAIVSTNQLLPDNDVSPIRRSSSLQRQWSYEAEEESSGHCGLFFATGGSGLAMRGFVAAKLPQLLLGSQDPDGELRDSMRGQVRTEQEGADTPDLVIQDCLRGRVKGCEVCAPAPERDWTGGSRRGVSVVAGDRWGKSGLVGTEKLLQMHLGYNASTLPGRTYGKEEWACGWRQPFNGEPDVLIV
ncbi:hypothetical protein T439DRAFT_56473 [Meredithblackwellia eburnea MCA 4105]